MKKPFVRGKPDGSWSIGNGAFSLDLDTKRGEFPTLRRLKLASPQSVNWALPSRAFGPVIEAKGAMQSITAGTMKFVGARASEAQNELVLSYECANGLHADVHLAPSAGHPVWRSWVVLRNPSAQAIEGITRFDAMNLSFSEGDAEPQAGYVLGWMEGPRGDAPGRHSIPWEYAGWIPKFLYGEGYRFPQPPQGGWSSPVYRLIQERLTRLPLRSGKRSTY